VHDRARQPHARARRIGARRGLLLAVAVLPALLWGARAAALDVPAPPGTPVLDAAGVLSSAARRRIEQEILAFEAATSTEIAVAIFPSLDDEPLDDFTIRLAERWRPGQADRDNGVILAIFVAERKVRIEVGYGLEGALPDALARRIIRDEIAPRFRAGDYDAGVAAAVRAIIAATRNEYRGTPGAEEPPRSLFIVAVFLLLGLMLFMRAANRLGRRGRHISGRGIFDGIPTILLGGGGGQRPGGWLGGGGRSFRGFGGGGFGGGGASGGW
jgi:uncharacterized protein